MQESTEPRRPSGFARWGWLGAAVNVVFVVANLVCVVFLNPSVLNWIAIAICTASGVYAYNIWRDGVRADREHRAVMADIDRQIARLRDPR